jgi:hypothetical protein
MTLSMTLYLCNIALNYTGPILWNMGSTQMNTLCGLMVMLHNSNLIELSTMLPSNEILVEPSIFLNSNDIILENNGNFE